MTTEHTPRKWERDGNCIYALNEQGYNRFSAWVQGGHTAPMEKTTDSELEANARLIAAAPDLLLALERITSSYRSLLARRPVRDVDETLAEVDAAIAKARGET